MALASLAPRASLASNRRGVLAMVTSMALFVVNDALVKLATATYPTGQVLAVRGLFATLAALVLVRSFGRFSDLKALAKPAVLLRGLLESFIAFTFIAALAKLTPREPAGLAKAAVIGAVGFAGQTFVLDSCVWPALFPY